MSFFKNLGLIAAASVVIAMLLAPGNASASGFYKYTTETGANDPLGVSVTVTLSLESGSSSLSKDTLGGANDTCTSSEINMKVESATPTSNPKGKISTFTQGGCSHTTTTLENGEMEFKNIAGTTNATVIIRKTRVTVKSTIFGISCVSNTGEGTTVGTLTGAKSSTGKATLHFNGVIGQENGCGDLTWTAPYWVTSPLGLTVENS